MKQSDIKILLGLLCVLILGGVYLYVYKPSMEDKEALDAEIKDLQTRYDELQAKEANRDKYLAETDAYLKYFEDSLDKFPAGLPQERAVMFIKGIDKEEEFEIDSAGLGTPSIFYTLAASPKDADPTGYQCYQATFPISYKGSYEGIKELVEYVMKYPERMNISSVNISYSGTEYSGSINLNMYAVTGNGRTDADINVVVPNGTDNIFLGGDGAASITTYEYDLDGGAALKTKNDIQILLNNAANDTADGIIFSTGDDASMVSSSSAEEVDATLTVAAGSSEGTYNVTYAIGESSYQFETTDKDVKLYVKSSKRVDTDDANGVKLQIENSTELPVFVLVDGDDTVSPRFTLGRKTGTVKVY